MSDSVVKLRIDSKEYDANIKRAGDALQQYFQKVKEGGGTLMHLDEGVLEAVKAMGELGTQAKSVKGGLRELTQATADMTVAYRNLTDEEKNSPIGQAMAQSIAQMTERAGQMRDAMADVQASIQNAASDTRTFDQIAGAANLTTSSFQTLQGAAKLLGVEMGDNVEVIAKLQAAMAVTNGLTQIQTALQKQSAVMQGVMAVQAAAAAVAQKSLAGATGAATIAQKAFNLVANANPYVLLATGIMAAVSALYLFTSGDREAEKAQADLNDELERTSKQLAAIDRETDFNVAIAEAAGKSWEEIHKLRLEAARTKLALADMSYDALVASGKATKDQLKQAAEESRKAWENVLKVLDEGVIHEIQMRNKKPTKPNGGGGTTTQKAQIYDAGELGGITITGNIMRSIDRAFEQAGTSSEGLSNYISALKQQIAKEDIGSDLYNSLTSKLTDASTMQTVIASALKAGVSGADLSDIAKEMKAKMLDGDIDDATWQQFVDRINEKIEKEDFKIKLTPEEKKGKGDEPKKRTAGDALEKFLKGDYAKITGGVSSIVSGINQMGVEIPKEIQNVLGVVSGITSILSGIATILTLIELNTQATAAASAVDAIVPLARGGIVPKAAGGYLIGGNSYSGDNVFAGNAWVNSGELVLNKSQQNNLASMITEAESRGHGGNGLARVSGEQIWIALNAYTKRSGKGELITWK